MLPVKNLFIFGSTGDLVKRKVVPALHALTNFTVHTVALGRKNLTTEEYQNFVCNGKCSDTFATNTTYLKIDLENTVVCEACINHLHKTECNYFYIALPPHTTAQIIRYIGSLQRNGYPVAVLIEKPFGTSYVDALHIQKIIAEEQLTEVTHISDHYLFKKEIMHLEQQPFKKLKLVSLERVGLETRAGYYDGVGALRDMVQSHFLNIVFKLVPNPQKNLQEIDVLVHERGQYGNGATEGYARDLGKKSTTETFTRVVIKARDQEFEFVTGKKFATRLGYLALDDKVVHFDTSDNPYVRLFNDFFSGTTTHFATIAQSILAWQLIEKIQKKEAALDFYNEDRSTASFTITLR